MAYPRFRRARSHKFIKRATGTDLVLNSTAIAELAAATNGPGTTGFDLSVQALAGDTLEWGFNGLFASAGVYVALDIYTMVGGSRVNPFGVGLSASMSPLQGIQAWLANTGQVWPLAGSFLYTVQSGDISSGTVTCRPHYVETTATNRTLYSNANDPLLMWLKNLGPVSV